MPVKNYVSRNGQVEYEYDDLGDILTYGRDALGNVVAGYDAATNAVFTADYKPYGEFAATTGNVAGRRFMWVGSWGYRFTSGVPVSHYVRARHLSMRMGMWTSVDPLWPSESAFDYVGGMPTAFVDPLGLQSNQPPRRIGPPKTMRDRPRPVNRPPRRNHGRGRPEPVLPVPQPKPSARFNLSKPKTGVCTMTICEWWGYFLHKPNHVSFCFQTGNPNRSCTADIHLDQEHSTINAGSCFDFIKQAYSESPGKIFCREMSIDCRIASRACSCIERWKRDRSNPGYLNGICYGYAARVIGCACFELRQLHEKTGFPNNWAKIAQEIGCEGY